jgi:preprotein translocase subunit SecA
VARAKKAAAGAAEAWGSRQLTPLEAEDRLAVACEKAPTDDATLSQLREVFQALEELYCGECDKQKAEVRSCCGFCAER